MTEFEIITLVLSITAILLSGFNIYITFFYKKSSLVGNILSFNIPKEDSPQYANTELECSLGNTGKRELLIRNAFIDLVGKDNISLIPEPKK